MDIPRYKGKVPFLTADQMKEVDRALIEDFHIELIQLMENAGRNLAHLARIRFLDNNPIDKKVVVLAGSGGNGGGALACARHLQNWGAEAIVFVTRPSETLAPATFHQLEILHHMKIPISLPGAIPKVRNTDLIVDGIIGYSLSGSPKGSAANLIRWANEQGSPLLALDIPSGIDATTGKAFDVAIIASATLTLALPKTGLRAPEAKAFMGELYLADIGVPSRLYSERRWNFRVGPIFSESNILRIEPD
ncbi:MAG: NAD(P)H-hydrate epimerase [Candidatus Aminicenantes bacterium]|nr:NAD(P)H-hydrate epimerase [Candidatus Aminicenantes bacterium]